MKIVNIFAAFINAVCLIVLLLAVAIQTPAFGLWFYEYEFEKNDSYAVVKMDEENLRIVAESLIGYLNGSRPGLENVEVVVNGNVKPFFNEKEILHMDDVKFLFEEGIKARNLAAIGFFATLAYFILNMIFAKNKGGKTLLLMWRILADIFLIVMIVTGIILATNFSWAFRLFHELSFANDLWLLNPATDLMINILPSGFFQDIAILIAGIFALSLVLVNVISYILRAVIKRFISQ